jgi:hypothetical protein
VRLHGSKNAQNLLKQVNDAEQMNVLANARLPPVVVLTSATSDAANNSRCAEFIMTEWVAAVARINSGHPDPLKPRWFVSNHKDAVALVDPRVSVAQADLPDGCEG